MLQQKEPAAQIIQSRLGETLEGSGGEVTGRSRGALAIGYHQGSVVRAGDPRDAHIPCPRSSGRGSNAVDLARLGVYRGINGPAPRPGGTSAPPGAAGGAVNVDRPEPEVVEMT